MSPAAGRLVLVSTMLLVVVLTGAVVAVVQGWPAQFGGGGNPDDVAGEALTKGTALSPPLAPVVLFVVGLALSVRAGTAGVVGAVLLMLTSLVFVIGGLGETFAAPTADVPRAALVLSGVLAASLGGAVIVAAIARLRTQR